MQKADRGTIFLNGVDALSPVMQMALLRIVTEGAFQPLGAHEVLTTTARIVAGSHCDLRDRVAEGRFRTDLYYALQVTELTMPPLRNRGTDVALLAEAFLREAATEHGKVARGIAPDAIVFLEAYDWPGNLPRLRNEITRMLILAQDVTLGADLISRHILQARDPQGEGHGTMPDFTQLDGTLKDRVEIMEMRILGETLTRLKWNKSRAAAELGLSRVGLRAKLDRYGIEPHASIAEED